MEIPSPNISPQHLETLWRQYRIDPQGVEASWRHFFMGVEFAGSGAVGQERHALAVQQIIRSFRKWGHLGACTDPLSDQRRKPQQVEELLSQFGDDLAGEQVPTLGILPKSNASLEDLVQALSEIYCGHMGIEYMDGPDPKTESWFQARIEPNQNRPQLSLEAKRSALTLLNQAELFERFLHAKYVGQKRFSLEGAEALIPALAEMMDTLGRFGGREIILGMSHRGRLNVLSNIMGKSYGEIFSEFEPNFIENSVEGDGDVKYHKGFASDFATASGGLMHVTLVDNPSHLEAVGPVVQGLARANQDQSDNGAQEIVPVLIHGDAAFPGQGVVSETLNLSQLEGYSTGGTIHIVINNQIGFTTDPSDARGTEYCTDVARQIMAPVFHVNGDVPEQVIHAVRIAAEFRQAFHRDVVIDLVCYRRHGHNEGDEPSFTQPQMYRKLKHRPTSRKVYVEQLIQQGEMEAQVARELESSFNRQLEAALELARQERVLPQKPAGRHLHGRSRPQPVTPGPSKTRVSATDLKKFLDRLTRVPEGFSPHRKLLRILADRKAMVHERDAIDWGLAEQLALAANLADGIPCRLSGQDVQRGTFSHRHASWYDLKTGARYTPLAAQSPDQARCDIYNSPLSEFAVLGFEFGYSLAKAKHLAIWEAQFGDFVNGAQVIIDQFLVSSETKWNLTSNLTLLLPHGYEGQGPEHSSGRLERFLQLCAESNIQVAVPTEPAQLFHLLRAQALQDTRKPLVVMTPKSLLRHHRCVSSLSDFTDQGFRSLIAEPGIENHERLLVCSGKIYYDLLEQRDQSATAFPILRVEQLYPLDKATMKGIAETMPNLAEVIWVQEEPQNMGAWTYIRPHLQQVFGRDPLYVGRAAAASPAVGSLKTHRADQSLIAQAAFDMELTGVVTV